MGFSTTSIRFDGKAEAVKFGDLEQGDKFLYIGEHKGVNVKTGKNSYTKIVTGEHRTHIDESVMVLPRDVYIEVYHNGTLDKEE